jgi:hypothetical protein
MPPESIRPMAARRWIVTGALGAAIVFAGCGGSSKKATTSSTARAASSAQLPPGAPPALRGVQGRVLAAGELSGFTPQGRRLIGINAASWVVEEELPTNQRAKEAARLRGLGFVAALRERLTPTNGSPAEGLSIVEQFRSPRAARTELAFHVTHGSGPGVTAFAVPAIPGGRGFAVSRSESSGLNVAFTKGPYYYLVGAGWRTGTPSPPTRPIVIAAAQRLYGRVQP